MPAKTAEMPTHGAPYPARRRPMRPPSTEAATYRAITRETFVARSDTYVIVAVRRVDTSAPCRKRTTRSPPNASMPAKANSVPASSSTLPARTRRGGITCMRKPMKSGATAIGTRLHVRRLAIAGSDTPSWSARTGKRG